MPCADQYQFYSQLIDPDNGNLSTTKCHDLGANSSRRVYLTDSITLGFTSLCPTNYSVSQLQWQYNLGAGWVNINPTAFPTNIPGIADSYAGGDGYTSLHLNRLKQSFDIRTIVQCSYGITTCQFVSPVVSFDAICPSGKYSGTTDGVGDFSATFFDPNGENLQRTVYFDGEQDAILTGYLTDSITFFATPSAVPVAPDDFQWQYNLGAGWVNINPTAFPTNIPGIADSYAGGDGYISLHLNRLKQSFDLRFVAGYIDNACSSHQRIILNNQCPAPEAVDGAYTITAYDSDGDGSLDKKSVGASLSIVGIPTAPGLYQWQADFGMGFKNLVDSATVVGSNGNSVTIYELPIGQATTLRLKTQYADIVPACINYFSPMSCPHGDSCAIELHSFSSSATKIQNNPIRGSHQEILSHKNGGGTRDVYISDTLSSSAIFSYDSCLTTGHIPDSTIWEWAPAGPGVWTQFTENSYPFGDATLASNVTSATLSLANVSFTTAKKIRAKGYSSVHPSCFLYTPELILNPICQGGTFSSYYVSLTTEKNHYHNGLVPIAEAVGGVEVFSTFLCEDIVLKAVSYYPPAPLDSIQWQFLNKTSNLWENLIEASFPFNDGINACNGTQALNTTTDTLTLSTFSPVNDTRTVRPVAFNSSRPECQTIGSEINLDPKCPEIFLDALYSYGIESGINHNHPIANPIVPTIGNFAFRDFFRGQPLTFNYVPKGIPCSPTHVRWEWADIGLDNWQSFVDQYFPFDDSIEFVCDGTKSINPTTPILTLDTFALLDTDPKQIRIAPYYLCYKTTPIPTCKKVIIIINADNCITSLNESNSGRTPRFKINIPSTFNEADLVGKSITYRRGGLSKILQATLVGPFSPASIPEYAIWAIHSDCAFVSPVILRHGDCSIATAGCPPGKTTFKYVLPNCTPCFNVAGGAGGGAGQGGIGKSDCFVDSSQFYISGLCPEVKIVNFYSSTIDEDQRYLAEAIDHAPSQGSAFQRDVFFCSSVTVVSNPVGSTSNPDTTIWQWAEINTNNWFDFVESEYPFGDNLVSCLGTQSNGVEGQVLLLTPFSASVPKKIRAKHNYACYPDCITYSSELRLDGICPPFTVVIVVDAATTSDGGGYFSRDTQKTAITTYSPVCAPDCYQWQKFVGGNWVNMVDQTIYDGTPPEQGGPLVVYSVAGATSATLTVHQMDAVGPAVETYRVRAFMCCSPQCSTTAS